ncbi:hypothetical protein BBJ28_00013267 [Nothophytophthora sp. Chile5]|nr:hypothetical protein BBJ28_00013267 [Nothophytophthora sp. Chile5]
MKSIQSQISNRKSVKLEFNRYERKLTKLRRRKDSAQRLERNEQKLDKTRAALQTVTCDLYRVFAKYESERDTMLNGELEMVRQVMHNFYAKNAEATDFAIPEDVDRSVVDSRTEQLYKSMLERELEQHDHRLRPSADSNNVPSLMPVAAEVLQSASISAPPAPGAPLPSFAPTKARPGDAGSGRDKLCAMETKEAGVVSLQPEQETAEEDELSEKLKTIQLSRPVVPPLKLFRLGRPLPTLEE